MSLTLARMQALLRKGLGGLDDTDLTDPEADELLNLALWELEDKFPFRAKEKNFDITLVVSQVDYDLATLYAAEGGSDIFDAIESIAVIDADDMRHKLTRTSRSWVDENYDSTTDTDATPARYLREGNTLRVYPAPDVALTMNVTMKESVASLATSGNTATGLPRNWDILVVQGATVQGHILNGDYNEARQLANFQLTAIRSAVLNVSKETRADSRYARVNVIWDEPEGA